MNSLFFIALASLPFLAFSANIGIRNGAPRKFACGNEDIPLPQSLRDLHAELAANGSIASSGQATIVIPTYFHIVSSTSQQNYVTDRMVQDQFATMNEAYATSGFQFALNGVDYTVNNKWAVGDDDATDTAMKTALRKGTYNTLNVYFQSDFTNGRLLGQCTYPQDLGPAPIAPSSYVFDGCSIISNSMPGGLAPYDLGYTAVHEVGHWLGLAHPFDSGDCVTDGDYVDDTPFQSTASYGCPSGKDTCSQPGVDSIHNYMDYSDDACMTEFTPGQVSRATGLWPSLRSGK